MQPIHRDDLETFQRSFARDGYVVLKNVVPREKLAALRIKILDELERSQRSSELFVGGGNISGHLNCFPGEESRFAYDALVEHGIVDLVKELAPKAFGPLRVGCNLNLPGSVAQHWHMDGIFVEDFMIANVAVVDTEIINGAIDLAPGTQQKFHRYWQFLAEMRGRESTRMPLKQGDVLVRSSKLWHRGMPNNTSMPRPMLAFTFGEKGVKEGEAFTQKGGKISFEPNWFRPTWLGRLRERTVVTAPITYSTYRFVTSLFDDKGYAH